MLDNKTQPVGRGIFSLAEGVRARLTLLNLKMKCLLNGKEFYYVIASSY